MAATESAPRFLSEPPAADGSSREKPAPSPRRFFRNVHAVFGLPFDACSLIEAVAKLRDAAFSNTRCFISTPNVNFVVAAQRHERFLDSVLRSDLSLADGMPIVWAARALGLPIAHRVAGASLFEALCACPGPPLSVYFFGGLPGVGAAACARLNAAPSGLRCVGFDSGGYGSVEQLSNAAALDRINSSGAHFVVVALGAEKGQAWIQRNAEALTVPLLCHLGAVVNFVAGQTARAPVAIQRLGLEWLWRVKEEPALWRRYVEDGAALVTLVLTRVLPGALLALVRPHRPTSLAVDTAEAPLVRLRLRGNWTRQALQPLRDELQRVVTPGAQLFLSMREVSAIDSSFVGLLLLAAGTVGSANLRITSASRRVRLTLWTQCADRFLDPSAT